MTAYRSMGARPEPDPGRGTAAVEIRKALASLVTGVGVLPGASSPLVRGTDSFAYIVGSGAWVTSRGTGDGVHLWGNDGDETISQADDGTSLAAPAPGLRRFDVIYALHRSHSENGDISSEAILAVRKGLEASIPTPPSLPAGALELGRNEMTSAATSTSSSGNTITQTAPAAAVRGTALARMLRARTSETAIPSGEWTQLSGWGQYTERTGSPASDVTAPSAAATGVRFRGWARVRASVAFQTAAAGNRGIRIMRNGSPIAYGGRGAGGPAGSVQPYTVEWEGPVSATDDFTVEVFQSSGAPLNTHVSNGGTFFFVERTA